MYPQYLYKVLFSITIQELEEPILFKYMLICTLEKMLRNEKLAIFFTVLYCLFNLLSRLTLPFSPQNFTFFFRKTDSKIACFLQRNHIWEMARGV